MFSRFKKHLIMSEPKLLRRPLPPKVETALFIPKRKDHKATSAVHPGGHGEDTESQEVPRDRGTTVVKHSASTKSHQILFYLPDSIDGTPSTLDDGSDSQAPGPQPSCLSLDTIKKDFVIPPQPSGPPSFPLQKRRVPVRFRLPVLKFRRLFLPSGFILKGYTPVVSRSARRVSVAYKKPDVSRFNYKGHSNRVMQMVLRSRQMGVNTLKLPPADFPFPVEEEQLLSETEAEQAAEISEGGPGEKSPLLRVQRMKRKKKKVTYADQVLDSEDLTLVSGTGCWRELDPEDDEKQLMIRAEVAVLCCLMHKRTGLSLKAYFLPTLPDLSAFTDFLVYLNLSFNDLRLFPTEVCDLKNLQILKLRNNPIKYIPEDVMKMTCLKTLVMSFNLLTELPPWLFMLPNLELFDASYNELEYISNAIGNARSLSYLIIEGNLLYFLPCGILKLQLKRLKIENNFLHPLFWNEFRFQPQRLTDMACLCFVQNNLWKKYPEIPEDIEQLLGSWGACDCCSGPLYGQGIRFLRIYKNIYGLRLPYVFSACSPACHMNFVI